VVLLLALILRWGSAPLLRRLLRLRPSRLSTGDRIRRVIDRMGVTYTKLGQFLAMRFDILPPEIGLALEGLFESAPEIPLPLVRRRLEQELGGPPEAVFARFEERPIAAASISQVHRAVTRDGETVAVKLQRPGIEEVLRSDLRLLLRTAAMADRLRVFGNVRAVALVEQFAEFTERELDFRIEGSTAEEVRNQSAGLGVTIPRIRWDLSTPRILTMQFVDGVSALWVCQTAETAGLRAVRERLPGVDLLALVETLGRACLHHMFVSGLFHGDPHPGNILVSRDGTPALLDFGIFGRLDPHIRRLLGRFYELLSNGNVQEAVRCYLHICPPSEATDLGAYRGELTVALREWYDVTRSDRGPLRERHPFRFVADITGAMRRNMVPMPPDQLLFWRALSTLGSLAVRWPVRFDLTATLRAFFEEQQGPIWQRALEMLQGASLFDAARAAEVGPGPLVALLHRASLRAELTWRTSGSLADRRQERDRLASVAWALLGATAAVAAAPFAGTGGVLLVLPLLAVAVTLLGLAFRRALRS
jgi:ubiquinone biosynthesis protein